MRDAEYQDGPNQQGACQQDCAGVHGSETGGCLQHITSHHITSCTSESTLRDDKKKSSYSIRIYFPGSAPWLRDQGLDCGE